MLADSATALVLLLSCCAWWLKACTEIATPIGLKYETYVKRGCCAAPLVLQGGGGWPSWNWGEFSVAYPSTASQLCIGGVYVRLLLEGGDPSECACLGGRACSAL